MVRRYPIILNSLLVILFFSASFILADGTGDTNSTMIEMSLKGREQTYRLLLPTVNPQPAPVYSGNASQDFNQAADQVVLDFPIRVYWEMTVSDCGGKNIQAPQLMISSSSGSTPANFVNLSYYADTQYGSFTLPPRTGMVVMVHTGSWKKQTGLLSSHINGYECKLKISYQLLETKLPQGLIQVNTTVVNDYINRMIIDHEQEIKAAIINDNLYDLKFHKVNFQMDSGALNVAFTAYYQGRGLFGIPFKTEASGTAAFEVRLSGDSSRIGLYGKGLVGKFDVARDLGLLDAWGRSYIDQKIAGREYWSGQGTPSAYQVFKTENLTRIINQALVSEKFHPMQYDTLGGLAQIRFKNIELREFSLAQGRAEARCLLDITAKLLGNELFNMEDAGSIDRVNLIFYINSANQSWWVRISGFHATFNGLNVMWNTLANSLISKKLEERNGLVPLNIPSFINRSLTVNAESAKPN